MANEGFGWTWLAAAVGLGWVGGRVFSKAQISAERKKVAREAREQIEESMKVTTNKKALTKLRKHRKGLIAIEEGKADPTLVDKIIDSAKKAAKAVTSPFSSGEVVDEKKAKKTGKKGKAKTSRKTAKSKK